MTDVCNIVVRIDIRTTFAIVQILLPTAHNFEWTLIRDTEITAHPFTAFGHCRLDRLLWCGEPVGIHTQQKIRAR